MHYKGVNDTTLMYSHVKFYGSKRLNFVMNNSVALAIYPDNISLVAEMV